MERGGGANERFQQQRLISSIAGMTWRSLSRDQTAQFHSCSLWSSGRQLWVRGWGWCGPGAAGSAVWEEPSEGITETCAAFLARAGQSSAT